MKYLDFLLNLFKTRPHKYTSKKFINGRWVYYYGNEPIYSHKQKHPDDVSATSPAEAENQQTASRALEQQQIENFQAAQQSAQKERQDINSLLENIVDSANDARAAQNIDIELSSDYFNARKSSVPNLGQDISGSARHKRGEARTFNEMYESEELVSVQEIKESMPIDFITFAQTNPTAAIVINKIFQNISDVAKNLKFEPNKNKEVNQAFLSFYKDMHDEINAIINSDTASKLTYREALNLVKNVVKKYLDNNNILYPFLVRFYNKNFASIAAGSPIGAINLIIKKFHEAKVFKNNDVNSKDLNDVINFIQSNKNAVAALQDYLDGKNLLDAINNNFNYYDSPPPNTKPRVPKIPADLITSKPVSREGPDDFKIDKMNASELSEFFSSKIKLNALQWGNSVTDKERQAHLKHAAFAFSDLATALNLDLDFISIKGKLNLSIGARGSGTAKATYEPKNTIINLTRSKGVGSLAHEWGHFLDNMLFKIENPESSSDNYFSQVESNTPLSEKMKKITSSDAFNNWARQCNNYLDTISASSSQKKYWLKTTELFARAFETYVYHKLKEKNIDNNYLCVKKTGPLYPNDEHLKTIIPLFDDFFDELKKNPDYLKKMERQLGLLQKKEKKIGPKCKAKLKRYSSKKGWQYPSAVVHLQASRICGSVTKSDNDSYRSSHKAPGPHNGAPLHNLANVYPEDIYSSRGYQYYGHGQAKLDKVSHNIIVNYKNQPKNKLYVYRAIPKNANPKINHGDWVTINKDYALLHGRNVLGDDFKIVKKQVKAHNLYNDGNSIHEWGYYPQSKTKPNKS